MTTTQPLTTEEAAEAGLLPASHWQQEPLPEDEDDDGASTIGSFVSSTASLSESIFKYRTIHGRTYHSEIGNADSWEPNDAAHIDALEVAHHACMIAIGHKLYLSPLEKDKVKKVVDIGTGPGAWVIDFADEFPNAEVIGTDITPIQPSWVPPNCKFELDDCNGEWTWPDNTFDFIHCRMMFGIVTDWYDLFRQAYRTSKPGGWVESFAKCSTFMSDDGSVKANSAMSQWAKVWNAGGEKTGRTFMVYDHDLQRKGMEKAGFVDITVKEFYIPVGVWHKDKELAEKGLWWKMLMETDLEGYLNYIFNVVMGWTPEETAVYAKHLRKELNDPNIHAYFKARTVYGRKPHPGEVPNSN
ncbi:S-adenosyl-L-methionine-dependent methyltransferase [Pseudoneurospora amorphoporcata]|uniref:S-adenosyl-L-methionine-dependent methyltransferase n=1 Tax=Pseudoneurospora amorphoporcata TaxID=241081 RepID=A0AAN6SAY5_9PEZI|nr:S-adenosyl-L-methionine-dependent methyltransferase [Pseudoneurospora amorphoporcata]